MINDVKIIANLKEPEQSRIAILENGKLAEIFIEYNFSEEDGFLSSRSESSKLSRQGDIFKARADTILPAINAAFVAISSKSHSHNEPRNAFLYINEDPKLKDLKPGHELIVQIIKNARKNKAPRVTTKLSLPGRWLVLMPDNDEVGVSRRISDMAERKRLKIFAEELKSQTQNCGIIIRTAAEGISEEFLRADFESLQELWKGIQEKSKTNNAPCLLYRNMGALGRVLRDEISGNIDEIIIDDPDEFENAKNFAEKFFPVQPNIQLYENITPIFDYFGIESEIQKAIDRKIWLRSGAYLIIDQTEALTVIDVNSGKFTSAPDMRHTVLATNLEAAEEIARQLRLRSIGGIVIVDFIDMDFNEDRHELLKQFENFLQHDRLKPRVFSITQLGLVELTRKRERPDLKSLLTRNCPFCGEDGFVEREENIAMNIKRFIRKITTANNSEAFLLQTSSHIANYISKYIKDWENEFGRKIFVASMPDFDWNKYRLEYQGELQKTQEYAKNFHSVMSKN